MAIGQPYNGMKKRKEKRKQKRVGERKKDMRIPGIRDYFLHFTRNRGNSRKAVCVLSMNTAFGYYLNKV